MYAVQDNPYFFKYMTSQHPIASPGKTLARIQADRLLLLAKEWDAGLVQPDKAQDSRRHIANTVQLLCTFLTMLESDSAALPVNSKVATALLPFLDRWKARFGLESGRKACDMTAGLLRRDPSILRHMAFQRSTLEGLYKCAFPTCSKETNLQACGRYGLVPIDVGFLFFTHIPFRYVDAISRAMCAPRLFDFQLIQVNG